MDELKPKGSTAVNIAQSVGELIRQGSWPPGYRLPTVRQLAQELGVNPNTVSAAYKQLRDNGIIATDGRRGSFVPEHNDLPLRESAIPSGLTDLASGNVDARLLPELPAGLLDGYRLATDVGRHGDHTEFTAFLRHWLQTHTGIGENAGMMLFSGSLDIIERALSQRCLPGSKVLIESPCWLPLLPLLEHLRLEAVPARMDEEGALIPPESQLSKLSAVILTARAHSPTGICYSLPRWQAWQRALAPHPALLLVDDHWAALSRHPFHGMDGFRNEWIYSTSTSKFLGTDARIALAAGNGATLQAMKKRFLLGPRWISKLLQHTVYSLWRQLGDDGLHTIADSYHARRLKLIGSLAEHGISVPGRQGEGQHIWLPVADEGRLIQFLAAHGWAVQSGAACSPEQQSAVRISLGNLDPADCLRLADDIADSLNAAGRSIY